jgi:hypothetical protein
MLAFYPSSKGVAVMAYQLALGYLAIYLVFSNANYFVSVRQSKGFKRWL